MKIPKPPSKIEKSEIISIQNKMPPQAIDLEGVLLGAILIDKNAIKEIYDILNAEMFFRETHRIIYQACVDLIDSGIGIDLLTVSDNLKRKNLLDTIRGDFYLISLTQRVSSSAHIEFHARIIIQKYVLRELIKMSNRTASVCYHSDPDIFDALEFNENHLARLKNVINIDNVKQLSPEEELKEKMTMVMKGRASGVHTNVSEFDDWCGGLQKRELIVIGARPGMGKTTLIIALSYYMVFTSRIPVALFSLEMSKVDLVNRFASILTGIPFAEIRQGKVNGKQYQELLTAFTTVRNSELHIEDDKFHYVVMERIKKLVKEFGVKIVFIDYVQLVKITENTKDATSELRTITRDLKALANSLNIPIVILSQLDRNIDSRHDKRPLLNDLKMSGSLEEDADTIMFPFRPAYYRKDVELPKKELGRVEFDIAKGRNIGTKKFDCHLDVLKYEFISMNDYDSS